MDNPCFDYLNRVNKSTFHPLDEIHAQAFNSSISNRKSFLLADHLEPLPYLGNPNARVIVLLANPGLSDSESKITYKLPLTSRRNSDSNLVHKNLDFLKNYLDSPKNTKLESKWFKARTRKLIDATSLEAVSKNLFFANYHPYHSKSWYPIPFTFPTQHYTFWLIKNAIEKGALIIMSRNMIGWFTAVPNLQNYKNMKMFRSSRSVHISQRNLGIKVFKKTIKAIYD